MSASQRRIILVTRRTRLEDLVIRLNTVEQARFYVEHMGADFSDYETEQRQYHAAVASTSELLSLHGRVQRLERKLLPNFLFPPDALVVVVGQDGLVANILAFNVGVEIGQILALSAILILVDFWRLHHAFARHAFASNVLLMAAGFTLIGFQLTGYAINT